MLSYQDGRHFSSSNEKPQLQVILPRAHTLPCTSASQPGVFEVWFLLCVVKKQQCHRGAQVSDSGRLILHINRVAFSKEKKQMNALSMLAIRHLNMIICSWTMMAKTKQSKNCCHRFNNSRIHEASKRHIYFIRLINRQLSKLCNYLLFSAWEQDESIIAFIKTMTIVRLKRFIPEMKEVDRNGYISRSSENIMCH